MKPVRGQVYTLAEVLKLDLLDSPFLLVNGQPIQMSRFSNEQLLKTSICNTRWIYQYTTREWCPVFVGEISYEALVDNDNGLIYPKLVA